MKNYQKISELLNGSDLSAEQIDELLILFQRSEDEELLSVVQILLDEKGNPDPHLNLDSRLRGNDKVEVIKLIQYYKKIIFRACDLCGMWDSANLEEFWLKMAII